MVYVSRYRRKAMQVLGYDVYSPDQWQGTVLSSIELRTQASVRVLF